MALHIVNAPQPQAPWWAGFAERAIMPMITGALERQRQRDENRKINTAIAEALNRTYTGGTGLPQPTGMQGGNGWGNLGSNLAQFDTDMADILPPSALNTSNPQLTPAAQQPNRAQLLENFLRVMSELKKF